MAADTAKVMPERRAAARHYAMCNSDQAVSLGRRLTYVSAESDGTPFEYVFVTNEFDPARLARACEKLAVNAPMFTHVVHISTDAVRATYGASQEPTMRQVLAHIEGGRLISLGKWLQQLNGPIA